ncbi:hypothetical protein EBU94_09495, partial [bacterium]|nr:hypothetical protein [bacterium]
MEVIGKMKKKIIKLTENDLERIVEKVINETLGERISSNLAGLMAGIKARIHNRKVSKGDESNAKFIKLERNLARLSQRARYVQP